MNLVLKNNKNKKMSDIKFNNRYILGISFISALNTRI